MLFRSHREVVRNVGVQGDGAIDLHIWQAKQLLDHMAHSHRLHPACGVLDGDRAQVEVGGVTGVDELAMGIDQVHAGQTLAPQVERAARRQGRGRHVRRVAEHRIVAAPKLGHLAIRRQGGRLQAHNGRVNGQINVGDAIDAAMKLN